MQGPNLYGIIGASVAAHANFNYTAAMKSHGGAWTYDRLFEYIRAPQKIVPGTAMSFAGIAKPQQFFDELEHAGWQVVGRRAFRDHHRYSPNEIETIARAARQAGATVLVTTSKDGVRLSEAHRAATGGLQVIEVPLHISIDPAFTVWLRERLSRARAA